MAHATISFVFFYLFSFKKVGTLSNSADEKELCSSDDEDMKRALAMSKQQTLAGSVNLFAIYLSM